MNSINSPLLDLFLEPGHNRQNIADFLNNLGLLRSRWIRHLSGVNLDCLTNQITSHIKLNPSTQEELSEALTDLMVKKWKVNPRIAKEKIDRALTLTTLSIEQPVVCSLSDPQFPEQLKNLINEKTIKITEFNEEIPVFVLKALSDQGVSFPQLTSYFYIFNLVFKDEKQQSVTQSFTCKGWVWKFLALKSDYFQSIENNHFKEHVNKALIIEGYSLEEFNLFLNVLLQKETLTDDNLPLLSQLSAYFQCQELQDQCQSKINSFLRQASLKELKKYLNNDEYFFMHENCKKYIKFHLEALARKDFKKFKEALSSHSNNGFDLKNLNFHIELSSNSITNQDFAYLTKLSNIHHLSLRGCKQITGEQFAQLTKLTHLRHLNLNGCYISDKELQYLAKLTQLQYLDLNGCHISDEGLQCLQSLTQLQHLDLTECHILGEGLQYLQNLTHLRYLNLTGCHISGEGLQHLHNLTQLHYLILRNCKHIDKHLNHLRNLIRLKYLDLKGCHISDEGVECLQSLTQLQHLDLSGCHISDEGIQCLQKLTQLRYLNLTGCNISNEGLQYLQKLTQLQHLNLNSFRITDEGVQYLQNLTLLRYLNLTGCHISDEKFNFLTQHLNKLKIQMD